MGKYDFEEITVTTNTLRITSDTLRHLKRKVLKDGNLNKLIIEVDVKSYEEGQEFIVANQITELDELINNAIRFENLFPKIRYGEWVKRNDGSFVLYPIKDDPCYFEIINKELHYYPDGKTEQKLNLELTELFTIFLQATGAK